MNIHNSIMGMQLGVRDIFNIFMLKAYLDIQIVFQTVTWYIPVLYVQ